jgi:hypothetical protein
MHTSNDRYQNNIQKASRGINFLEDYNNLGTVQERVNILISDLVFVINLSTLF